MSKNVIYEFWYGYLKHGEKYGENVKLYGYRQLHCSSKNGRYL